MTCRPALAAALALACAFPALAQQTGQSQMQGGTTSAPLQTPSQQPTQAVQPIVEPGPMQIMGSDLRGATIVGSNNESIGTIDDFLFDRDGRLAAVIVGVGGFLGIGEKDVAIPFQALEIVGNHRRAPLGMNNAPTDANPTGATGVGAGASAGAGFQNAPLTTPDATSAPGATGRREGSDTNPTSAANVNQGTTVPDRLVLRGMSRADLENAPAFRATGTAGTGSDRSTAR